MLLTNILPYTPGYSGFTSYSNRVLPHLDSKFLHLTRSSPFIGLSSAFTPLSELPRSRYIRLFHRLTLTQHAVRLNSVLSKSILSRISCVYSPYFDFLFGLPKIPQIITVHDLTPLYIYNSLAAHFRYKLYSPLHLFKATQIIAISRSVADDLIHLGVPSRKIEVIYNGITFDKNYIPSREVDSQVFEPYFVVIARHDDNKGLDLLIKGFALLLSMYSLEKKPTLVIVGREGPKTGSIKKLAKHLRVDQSIRFIHSLSSTALKELLLKSTALLSGSRYEGFNYTVLEAQSLNIPTIISSIPVHREIYGSSSLLFSLDDCGN
jgi:glycosyltransferase involved in cell wall biosynthesis